MINYQVSIVTNLITWPSICAGIVAGFIPLVITALAIALTILRVTKTAREA